MAGFTDIAFRQICKNAGADVVVSEMINVISIHKKTAFSRSIIKTGKEQSPFGIQLFGSNPEDFEKAILELEIKRQTGQLYADFYDINFGCPMPKIIYAGAGARLLLHPKKMAKIIKVMVRHSSIPITAKIRLGYAHNSVIEIFDEIKDTGLSALAIHGRTAKQKYSGIADWSSIQEIFFKSKIPIIGNGDIKTKDQAIARMQGKYADSVMIGRAALSNPLLFSGINPDPKERRAVLIAYIDLCKKYNIENLSSIKMHCLQVINGFKGSSSLRQEISVANSIDEIYKILDALLDMDV